MAVVELSPSRHRLGEQERARRLEALAQAHEPCRLCPRRCGARRLSGQSGRCGPSAAAPVVFWGPHFGEEPPIAGTAGAGNVFFAGCNVGCVFCQNHQISRASAATYRMGQTVADLAGIYLKLQEKGCHNINWVTPGHVVPAAVAALFEADEKGLSVPLVYNTSGYERVETLKLLDGIVDIYLPDFKYGPNAPLEKLCEVSDYPEVAEQAIVEMWRQVGPLVVDTRNIATAGLIVRHLVLPSGLADTQGVLGFISKRFGGEVSLSLMAQYTPAVSGLEPPLDRPLTEDEYASVVDCLGELGLVRGFLQERDSSECYTPDFGLDDPFQATRPGADPA